MHNTDEDAPDVEPGRVSRWPGRLAIGIGTGVLVAYVLMMYLPGAQGLFVGMTCGLVLGFAITSW